MTAAAAPTASGPAGRPPGGLAQVLQEALTIGVLIKAGKRAPTDPEAFRAQVKQILASADGKAKAAGYSPEHVRLAIYAVIAFLDEVILDSSQPMFAVWSRQSLQEEVFGDNVAGEAFFKTLERLLTQRDSAEAADVLEVYQLCMLLGFHGKYAANDGGALFRATSAVNDKIARIRGPVAEFSPRWQHPKDLIRASVDPWVRRLGILATIGVGSALFLFLAFWLLLRQLTPSTGLPQ